MSDVLVTLQIQRADAQWLQDNLMGTSPARARILRALLAALPPKEPTRRGAVVEAGGVLHWGDGEGHWRTFGYTDRFWEEVCAEGVPVVHFEGVPKGDYSGRYPNPEEM